MPKFSDYRCGYDNGGEVEQWTAIHGRPPCPQAYARSDLIAELAKDIRAEHNAGFCLLPFCHTLEAEALGAEICFDGGAGPRARGFRCQDLQEVPGLTMELTTPRLQETLSAAKLLLADGETVVFQLSGPMTILNSLLPSEVLFRSMRKKPELFLEVCRKLCGDLLKLAGLAEESGIGCFSYADPLGSAGIIGPKAAEFVTKGFVAPFLRELDGRLQKETLVLLCPKTALALLDAGAARQREIPLPQCLPYGTAAAQMRGCIRFMGQSCIHKGDCPTDRIRQIVIGD